MYSDFNQNHLNVIYKSWTNASSSRKETRTNFVIVAHPSCAAFHKWTPVGLMTLNTSLNHLKDSIICLP